MARSIPEAKSFSHFFCLYHIKKLLDKLLVTRRRCVVRHGDVGGNKTFTFVLLIVGMIKLTAQLGFAAKFLFPGQTGSL